MDAPDDRDNTGAGVAAPAPVPASVPATEASKTLSDLLNRVMYGRERIVITRHGRPAAELVPAEAA